MTSVALLHSQAPSVRKAAEGKRAEVNFTFDDVKPCFAASSVAWRDSPQPAMNAAYFKGENMSS